MVSVVTVNYNGSAVTEKLLQSLQVIDYPHIEIIVVDNASAENVDWLKEKYPYITLIKNTENKGFAAANNDGFRVAKGEFFMMLNNDTEVESDFLWPLVKTIQSSRMIGLVCPKLKYFDDKNVIQFAGYTPISKYTGRGFPIGDKEDDDKQYDRIYTISHGHGAAMLLKREIFEKVGPMREDYFLYYEELDYCERIRWAGYNLIFNGHSTVYHKESMTVGKNSPLKVYYNTRNRILFVRRTSTFIQRFIFLFYYGLIVVPVHSLRYLLKGENEQFRAMVRGLRWNMTHKSHR
ncbi:MAG: glycosyltransferase family 2 protein [Mucilaginibacter polytrichastri]|nr:glycosyltransferase family 2 protein [Mucilaginibacter polytrichastri]